MKILLIGTGGVGEAVAKIAHQHDPDKEWLELMVLSDYNLERAQEVAGKIGFSSRFPVEQVNARNKDEIIYLVKKYQVDLIFNDCDPSFNETIFDAAYACGVNYLDMALTLSIPHPFGYKLTIKNGYLKPFSCI